MDSTGHSRAMRRLALLFVLGLLAGGLLVGGAILTPAVARTTHAQDEGDAEAGASFPIRPRTVVGHRGDLPSPSKFLGRPLGSRFTGHADVLRYCDMVASGSERVRRVRYGESAEGRELYYLIVTKAERFETLDRVKSTQQTLANATGLDAASVESMIADQPAIVWLSYNVHGNENSCTETAMQTLWDLADGEGSPIDEVLEECVVIIDPLLNPDGRERYVNWYHSVAAPGGNPDPAAREHREPWPGGRTNHYYFDLNRDWSWQSQPETRQRVRAFLEWMPIVHVDFHEMGVESEYFFFPAEKPVNTNLPASTLEWGQIFGQANAAAFDEFGWLYFTAEVYDLFYPGYGDTWPSLHGAIGMTYEQGGGGRAGLRYRLEDGRVKTLTERLHHHHVSGLATLRCVAERRQELVSHFSEFRREATENGGPEGVREYLFPPQPGRRAERLAELLIAQGVRVERTSEAVQAGALIDVLGNEAADVALPAGTWIVSCAQPAGRLANALLEPRPQIPVAQFYDISAWSLPLAMGVECYSSAERIETPRSRVQRIEPPEGGISGSGDYAFVLPWTGRESARALIELHRRGIRGRLVAERFEIEDVVVRDGAIAFPTRGEASSLRATIEAVAKETGVVFQATDTGMTSRGIDFGSDTAEVIAPRRIAVATGPGIRSGSFGAVWYLFEQELGLDFTAIDLERLASTDLRDYDVIVVPDGSGWRRTLSERFRGELESWTRSGGVVVAIGASARAMTKDASGFTSVEVVEFESDDEDSPRRRTLAEVKEDRRRETQVGAIFELDLDPDHPMTLGLPAATFALVDGPAGFRPMGTGGDFAAYTTKPAVSGFVPEAVAEALSEQVYACEVRKGRGRVILFAADPNFRLFWRGLETMFVNAVLLR